MGDVLDHPSATSKSASLARAMPGKRQAVISWTNLAIFFISPRNQCGQFRREIGMTVMTKELGPSADSCDPDDGPEDKLDHQVFADPGDVTAETYPHLRNVSAGFGFKRVVRTLEPSPLEYVTLLSERGGSFSDGHISAIAKWNLLWQSGQLRSRYIDYAELPPEIPEIAYRGDVNVFFVPRTATRYYEYSSLYHLLSRSIA